MNAFDVIKTVALTEKTNALAAHRQYAFVVDKRANKLQIKAAVETLFDRKVQAVNTINRLGHRRRTRFGWGKRPDIKKAIVTLKEGQEPLNLF